MDKIKIGQTKVVVKKREVDERTGRENIRELHRGIIVQGGNSFVRVYNPAPTNEGGDTSQANSELFAISARNIWIEPAGELKEPILLAPELR